MLYSCDIFSRGEVALKRNHGGTVQIAVVVIISCGSTDQLPAASSLRRFQTSWIFQLVKFRIRRHISISFPLGLLVKMMSRCCSWLVGVRSRNLCSSSGWPYTENRFLPNCLALRLGFASKQWASWMSFRRRFVGPLLWNSEWCVYFATQHSVVALWPL